MSREILEKIAKVERLIEEHGRKLEAMRSWLRERSRFMQQVRTLIRRLSRTLEERELSSGEKDYFKNIIASIIREMRVRHGEE